MAGISKVLIANRGEIAVRIARACADSGIGSVAVYADPDRDAVHVKVADEAYSLGGSSPAQSYLMVDKLLGIAATAGADAVHPGYGFLAENASFAQSVLDAGMVWIGPSPESISILGDKVKARHLAALAGASLVAGSLDPVEDADEIVAFAREHGLPIAIKAAFGGGGRGLKVAYTLEEIPELFDSATREAISSFGRGECFVERYLDKARHIETQCLADMHGNVVVVSTRDCSLQRRHQKLVEEAPAPFLTAEQHEKLVHDSKAILKAARYHGAGTCEFLLGQDGTVSFLEVNTRLQVEHPVSEEVTGIDLVCEQLRIAGGEVLGYDDPTPTRHSIEFRINGEDPGRGFLPSPGLVADFRPPSGPGVRLDSGVESGDVIGGGFDSMLAKLVITGRDRQQALARSRRALAEFVVIGIPTVLPFHRKVVDDEAFAPKDPAQPFAVHTRWIETEFVNDIPPYAGAVAAAPVESDQRQRVVIEVGGKRLDVVLPSGLIFGQGGGSSLRKAPKRSRGTTSGVQSTGDSLTAPMQGTVVKIAVQEGQVIEVGQLVVVIDAMKMEQPILAHKAGTITALTATVGAMVANGAVIAEIKD